MKKKILFLGGSFFQIPPIRYAKDQGHYIITCDYFPHNPGHKYADEYHNVSTTDQEAALELARRLGIDGVVVYGSDPAAITAAYIADKLGLCGNPYESVKVLTQKDIFRDFLRKNNFNTPFSASFSSLSEAEEYLNSVTQPVMIKPVDSSGSKGVFKITSPEQLPLAFAEALSYSRVKRVIIEEYIERKGCQIAGDGFVINGKLVFRCFGQEHFNKRNPFSPVGESFPLQLAEVLQSKVHDEIERLLLLLNMKTGALNFDIVLNKNNDVFLMEIGPRAGGHLISEVIKYSTGVDLVKYIVDGALGLDCTDLKMYETADCYSNYAFHSEKEGLYKSLVIDETIEKNIIEKFVFVEEGTPVSSFKNSNGILGCLILKFESPDEMLQKMESINEMIKVEVI